MQTEASITDALTNQEVPFLNTLKPKNTPLWLQPFYWAYTLQLTFLFCLGAYGSMPRCLTKDEIAGSRLNVCGANPLTHVRLCLQDLAALVVPCRSAGLKHALVAFPLLATMVGWALAARFLLPGHLRRVWNVHYERAIKRYRDPRAIRDLSLNIRPLVLGGMTLCPPTALVLLAVSSVQGLLSGVRGNAKPEEIPGHQCFRFVQNPDKSRDANRIVFYHSPVFPLIMLAVFAAGIPAGISAWLYFNTGVDALLGYPSLHPRFYQDFLCIGLYLGSLSWCLSVLFFRSYLTYALSHASSEFDLEIYPDVIKALPIKGWFRDFAFLRRPDMHQPQEIAWSEVTAVTYRQTTLKPAEASGRSPSLAGLQWTSRLVESISTSLDLQTDYLEVKSPERSLYIRLKDLSKLQKAQLFMCLRKFAPSIHLDKSVQAACVGSTVLSEPRYTQIWFDVLAARQDTRCSGQLEAGSQLQAGAYTTINKVGSGGQAVIYTARTANSQTVVLKQYQLTPGESLAAMIESARGFETESSLLAQLSHPGIVSLLDMFYEAGCVYVVLEHIEGASLRHLVQEQGPLDQAQVLELALQMCGILQYLHSQELSVVHRDFSPDNLILEPHGHLKLIDFSIARSGKHIRSDCAGKHAYTPPEQFRGEPCPQSDIYALGATMFYLLTGEEPEPISPSSPRAINQGICEELDRIVQGCTQIALSERYEAVPWLQADLEALKAGSISSCSRAQPSTGVIEPGSSLAGEFTRRETGCMPVGSSEESSSQDN